jgi:hypothetical protein
MIKTNDTIIRAALIKQLKSRHLRDKRVRILEELGLSHGAARIDIAVVNGIMHGYEIKSDQDTLGRLPEQIEAYGSVFDKVTLVVGKDHLYDAINLIPEWWGLIVAKNINDKVLFNRIREEGFNEGQDSISIARLLWRKEGLGILEKAGEAKGLYSKPRALIYEKLSAVFDRQVLCEKVRETIFVRTAWRPDAPLILNGG